ncbi:unnamed protein product [Laminaria digitata]
MMSVTGHGSMQLIFSVVKDKTKTEGARTRTAYNRTPGESKNGNNVQTNAIRVPSDCKNGNNVQTNAIRVPPDCKNGNNVCDDPQMHGLCGQTFDWSGVDSGWYCFVKHDHADVYVNLGITAPLPEDLPGRQLITGISLPSARHSLVIQVNNPYGIDTNGCPDGISPCLANGGLRTIVDGQEEDYLLRSHRQHSVARTASLCRRLIYP